MDDYIIIRTGYNIAIKEVLDIVDDDVLKDKILRLQRKYWSNQSGYECIIYKYYDEEHNIGYILFDDINELKGVCIFVKEKTYIGLEAKELIFAKQNYKLVWSEKFNNIEKANEIYLDLLKGYTMEEDEE